MMDEDPLFFDDEEDDPHDPIFVANTPPPTQEAWAPSSGSL